MSSPQRNSIVTMLDFRSKNFAGKKIRTDKRIT